MVVKVEKIKHRSQRGRPILLNDVLKQTIILYKSTNPSWSAGKILESIKLNYYNKLKKAHPDWPDNKIREESAFPGVNRIQRYLKEVSPLDSQKSPLEEKWHLGTMNDYPITPEAVKKIFELKSRGKDYISIRMARWISRLSVLPLPVDVLYLSAIEYSTAEEIAEISHTELNTANLDMILQEHMKNTETKGNGSRKADNMPVKTDVSTVKIDAVPGKNEAVPVKSDIAAPKAEAAPDKFDSAPVKKETPLAKSEAVSIKKEVPPVKSEATPLKKEVSPVKPQAAPVKNEAAPSKIEPVKPNPEVKTPEVKPRESVKQWHLPDLHKRQSSIEEFLKFVEKQKDIDL